MMTLPDLFTAYLADVHTDHEPSTYYQQGVFFRTVARELGAVPLEDVTPALLRQWKGTLSLRHKPSTVYRYMMFFNCALRWAVEVEWLAENPLQKVRKPSPGRGRVRFLTDEERPRLLAACRQSRNPLLYAIVVMALSTGGRKNEIRKLQWPAVDFEHVVVRFLKTKNHDPRSVPLLGEARTLLLMLAETRDAGIPWVFPSANGLRPREIESSWATARQHAHIVDFHFHDLRHTFASYMAMSGAGLRDIAEVLGHRKIQQTLQYAHLIQSHTQGIVEQMIHKYLT